MNGSLSIVTFASDDYTVEGINALTQSSVYWMDDLLTTQQYIVVPLYDMNDAMNHDDNTTTIIGIVDAPPQHSISSITGMMIIAIDIQ